MNSWRSCLAARGKSSFSAKSRAMSRTRVNSWSNSKSIWMVAENAGKRGGAGSGIVVEALACLLAEPPGGDHAAQERARTVLVVAEPGVQHLEDVEAHVEPDQV